MQFGEWTEQIKMGAGAVVSWAGSITTVMLSIESANQIMALAVGGSTLVLTWAWFFYVRAKTGHLHERREREQLEYEEREYGRE